MRICLKGAVARTGLGKQTLGPLDLVLEQGITAIIGHNGSGKTTWLQAISMVYKLSGGRITYEIEGESLSSLEAKLTLGYVPQEISLYEDMTVSAFLKYIAELKCLDYALIDSEIERVLSRIGLKAVGERRLQDLSVGQQRRAMIAQALLGSPAFLIMDEPYVGLDIEQRRSIHYFLQEYSERAVVVVATHYVEELREGDYDRVVELRGAAY